jgi:hypothetical protein
VESTSSDHDKQHWRRLVPLGFFLTKSLFRRGKFSATLSLTRAQQQPFTVVFVVTSLDLKALLDEPACLSASQSFIELDGYTLYYSTDKTGLPPQPDLTKFLHICILGGSTCLDNGSSVQKAMTEIADGENSLSKYAYFRHRLVSHIENWRPRLPEPPYPSRRFLHASPRPRQPREKPPPRPRSLPQPQSLVKPYKLPVPNQPQSNRQPGIERDCRIPRPVAQPRQVQRKLKSARTAMVHSSPSLSDIASWDVSICRIPCPTFQPFRIRRQLKPSGTTNVPSIPQPPLTGPRPVAWHSPSVSPAWLANTDSTSAELQSDTLFELSPLTRKSGSIVLTPNTSAPNIPSESESESPTPPNQGRSPVLPDKSRSPGLG